MSFDSIIVLEALLKDALSPPFVTVRLRLSEGDSVASMSRGFSSGCGSNLSGLTPYDLVSSFLAKDYPSPLGTDYLSSLNSLAFFSFASASFSAQGF